MSPFLSQWPLSKWGEPGDPTMATVPAGHPRDSGGATSRCPQSKGALCLPATVNAAHSSGGSLVTTEMGG